MLDSTSIKDSSDITREDSNIATPDIDEENQDKSDDKSADITKLETRVDDTTAKLKEAQKALTLVQMEKAKLEGELSGIKGTAQEQSFVDPLESELNPEEFNLDPANGIKSLMKQERALMASIFQARDKELKEELRSILRDEVNPDRLAMKDVIDELKGNSWFDKLSASEQVEAAKQFKSVNKNKESLSVPSDVSGTGRKIVNSKTKAEEAKKFDAAVNAMFGAISGTEPEPLMAD